MWCVRAKTTMIESALGARNWSPLRLAAEIGCSPNTAKRIVQGDSLGGHAIGGLLTVFAPATFEDLFEVVETDDED